MLIGQYQSKINEKGRVALPAKFKRQFGKRIIVTAGYEQSLMLVDQKDWEAVVERINQGSSVGPAREADRFLLGSAHEVEPDSQGRFVIPRHLRQFASLNEAVVFVGVGNRAEIWSQTTWEGYSRTLADRVAKLGLKLDASTSSFTTSH